MTTMIAVYNSDGCVGRCDAKCYNATEPDCNCVCGGRNHGAGRKKAIENTRQFAERMIEEYAGQNGLENFKAEISQAVQQLDLFSQFGAMASSPAAGASNQKEG